MSSHPHEQTKHKPTPEINFGLKEAQEFAENNGYAINNADQSPEKPARCIDDRDPRKPDDPLDPLPPYAIPGNKFGVLIAVLEGTRAFEKTKQTNAALSTESIIRAVETVIGKISYHTDNNPKHASNPDALAFAGCGHCAGNFNGLSASDKKYITEIYIPELKNAGIEPTVYTGEHNAVAVMVLEDNSIGLPSTDGTAQVYVYNRKRHHNLLNAATQKITKLYDTPKLSEKIAQSIEEAADAHLEITMRHLAEKLPKFIVKKDEKGKITVELI